MNKSYSLLRSDMYFFYFTIFIIITKYTGKSDPNYTSPVKIELYSQNSAVKKMLKINK